MKVILRSTELNVINIPSKLWKKLGWELNDEVELIECELYHLHDEEYNDGNDFSHKTITIERTKDQIIEKEEGEK